MIRSFTSLIFKSKHLAIFKKNHFHYFFLLLRKSIIFRKFKIFKLKLLRKTLLRFKHKWNWNFYFQPLRYWTKFNIKIRANTRSQVVSKLFEYNVVGNRAVFFKNNFSNFEYLEFFSNFKKKNKHTIPFVKNLNLFYTNYCYHFLSTPFLINFSKLDTSLLVSSMGFGDNLKLISLPKILNISALQFDFTTLLSYNFIVFMQKIREFYKILQLLYLNILTLNKYVFKIF